MPGRGWSKDDHARKNRLKRVKCVQKISKHTVYLVQCMCIYLYRSPHQPIPQPIVKQLLACKVSFILKFCNYHFRKNWDDDEMMIYIDTSALLCIYMHRESGSDSEVDPIVKLIWSKVCITIYITISITSLITIVAQECRGSYRGVPGTIQGWI